MSTAHIARPGAGDQVVENVDKIAIEGGVLMLRSAVPLRPRPADASSPLRLNPNPEQPGPIIAAFGSGHWTSVELKAAT